MLEKTENQADNHNDASTAAHAAVADSAGCVTVACLTEQLDKKTAEDQAKLFAQMRADAIRDHLSPPPAHLATHLVSAAAAAQSEAESAQSPAEAAAPLVVKNAADAAKALPAINAAIQQNEHEYNQLVNALPPKMRRTQLAPKPLTPQEKYEQQMKAFENNLQSEEHSALVQQNDDARAAEQNEQKLEAKAAAKDRLVQAITQAKVGKGVPLLPVPQI